MPNDESLARPNTNSGNNKKKKKSSPMTLPVLLRYKTFPQMARSKMSVFIAFLMPILVSAMCVSVFAPVTYSDHDTPSFNKTSPIGEAVLYKTSGDNDNVQHPSTPKIFYTIDNGDQTPLLNTSMFNLFERIYNTTDPITINSHTTRFDNNTAMISSIYNSNNILRARCDITIRLGVVESSKSSSIVYEIQTNALSTSMKMENSDSTSSNNLLSFNPVVEPFDQTVANDGTSTLQVWLLQSLSEVFTNTSVNFVTQVEKKTDGGNNTLIETKNLPGYAFYPQPPLTDDQKTAYRLRQSREISGVRITVLLFSTLAMYGAMIVSAFVEDKESGLRAMFDVTGASPTSYILSLLIESLIVRGASAAAILGMLFGIGIFKESSYLFIWIMYMLIISALCMLGYACSTLFSSGRFSGFFSFIFYCLCIGVGALLAQCETGNPSTASVCSADSKAAISFFFPPVAQIVLYDSTMRLENDGIGASFSTMFETPVDLTNKLMPSPPPGTLFILLICSSFFYFLLGRYLEQVIPHEKMGISRSFLFPLEGWLIKTKKNNDDDVNEDENNDDEQQQRQKDGYIPPGRPLLKINKLKKQFGDFVAVDFGDKSDQRYFSKVSADTTFYENEVIVISAANGGGKTTTISMLMSVLEPSSGDATYYIPSSSSSDELIPTSLRKSPHLVRGNVSYCPQFSSAMVPRLTVREHFHLFGALRGVADVESRIKDFCETLEFGPKLDCQANALSGGMARQMFCAMSFLDDSRVVFLDEPTSGVASESRRKIWDFTREEMKRLPRLIFLTTHYCDEAEILASRIAMMRRGKLLGVGAPNQIARDIGAGYFLRFLGVGNNANNQNQTQNQNSSSSSAENKEKQQHEHHQRITDFVRSIAHSAVPKRVAASELVLNIPFSEPKIVPLLRALESDPELKDSFQFEQTTFEEAFLSLEEKITSAEENPEENVDQNTSAVVQQQQDHHQNDNVVGDNDDYGATSTDDRSEQQLQQIKVPDNHTSPLLRVKGKRHFFLIRIFYELCAVFYMRVRVTMRDYTALLFQVVFPIAFLICGIISYTAGAKSSSSASSSSDGVSNANPFMHFDTTSAWLAPYSLAGFNTTESNDVSSSSSFSPEFITGNTSSSYPTRCCYDQIVYTQLNNYSSPSSATWEIDRWEANNNNNKLINVSMNFFVNPLRKTALLQTVHDFFQGVFGVATSTSKNNNNNNNNITFIKGSIRPLPMSAALDNISSQIILALFVALSFSFVPASYAAFAVRMRSNSETNSAALQIASGASNMVLWVGGYLFDTLSTLFFSALVILVLYVGLKDSEPLFIENLNLLWLSLLIYTLSTTLLSYFLSSYIERYSRAQLTLALLYFATVAGLVIGWISVLGSTGPSSTAARIVTIVFAALSPLFACTLITIMLLNVFGARSGAIGYCANNGEAHANFTDYCVTGWIIWIMWLQLGGYAGLLLLQQLPYDEWKGWLIVTCCYGRGAKGIDWATGLKNPDAEEDEDVKREREHVEELMGKHSNNKKNNQTSRLVVSDLRKKYDDGTIALRGVSFDLSDNGIYAISGPNSSGKSTLVKTLMMQQLPTSGSAYFEYQPSSGKGISIFDRSSVQEMGVGYCPQHDQLLPEMTVYETLRHYAMIKGLGVFSSQPKDIVEAFLEHSTLAPYRDREVGKLSGGNKRKVSLAIALLGNPRLVIGDELAAGVDVMNKRALYKIVSTFGGTFVLVSHSMEEVTTLCNRKAMIFLQGKMRAFGSVPSLRKKFGTGFSLELQTDDIDKAHSVAEFVYSKFPGCNRLEEHLLPPTRQKYWLPSSNSNDDRDGDGSCLRLSSIFEIFESNKQVTSFSVSQTSLEKVYLQLVADQEKTDEIVRLESQHTNQQLENANDDLTNIVAAAAAASSSPTAVAATSGDYHQHYETADGRTPNA